MELNRPSLELERASSSVALDLEQIVIGMLGMAVSLSEEIEAVDTPINDQGSGFYGALSFNGKQCASAKTNYDRSRLQILVCGDQCFHLPAGENLNAGRCQLNGGIQ
jgi:hypothetical protein